MALSTVLSLCHPEPCPLIDLLGESGHQGGKLLVRWEEQRSWGKVVLKDWKQCPVCQGRDSVWILPVEPGSLK